MGCGRSRGRSREYVKEESYKTGDIIFFEADTGCAAFCENSVKCCRKLCIKMVSKYTHCGIIYIKGETIFVLESTNRKGKGGKDGKQMTKLSEYASRKRWIWRNPTDPEVKEWYDNIKVRGYDSNLCDWCWIGLRCRCCEPHSAGMTCSEFVAHFLDVPDAKWQTPQDLLDRLVKVPVLKTKSAKLRF
jgi:hypothetical protein